MFSIDADGKPNSVTFDGTKKIEFDLVNDKIIYKTETMEKPLQSLLPSLQFMKKIGVGQINRDGASIKFRVAQSKVGKFLEEKYLVYDQAGFKGPSYKTINEPRQGSTYAEIDPHWAINHTWREIGYKKPEPAPVRRIDIKRSSHVKN